MTEPLDVAQRYVRAIEAWDEDLLSLLDPDIVYRELPNRLMPEGSLNDRTSMLERFAKGNMILKSQRYVISNAVVAGEQISLEVAWHGVLAVPRGSLDAGDTMRRVLRDLSRGGDGRVVAQRKPRRRTPF